ncbi:hypothetical protein NBT05_03525 [Aquimarina sp. ERC-38]|uniref:hypothetical protein n=1 Tax=Aquimarina sp. ERC-38 TaxID=2949996 RepID=UPI002246F1EA|nr:hypothetical protein [Aquimarina sp. ERC-38]UZO81551.1 hypothetical protein NBT05_03525 [Aquimarina sp. ERC-38]
MTIYVGLIILGLIIIGFWEISMLKDSLLWIAFAGFPLLMKTNNINSEQGFLNLIMRDSLKGIVIIEFIANLYTFSLITELILILIMTFVGAATITTKGKPEYKSVEKLFSGITSIFGVIVLTHTIYKITQGFGNFASLMTVKSFLLPIILTFAFVPLLYCVALWSFYEITFIRMNRRLKKKKQKRYLKKRMFTNFWLNRGKLRRFQSEMGFEPIMSNKDIDNVIFKFMKEK